MEWLPADCRFSWSYAQYGSPKTPEEFKKELSRLASRDNRDLNPLMEWNSQNANKENILFTRDHEIRALQGIQDRRIIDWPMDIASFNACCLPGSRRVYVTVKGDFKVCERIGEAPLIGNVYDGLDMNVIRRIYFNDYQERSLPACSKCWAVHLCNVCYAYCMNEQGLDTTVKSLVCERIKYLAESDLIRYHELLKNDAEQLATILQLSSQ